MARWLTMCVEALLSVRAGMYSDCSVGLALFRYIYLNRDMRLCWGCYYSVTWHTCCLFLVLKAALQWSDVIFWIYQSALVVPILVFTHLLIMFPLWLFKTISSQPLHRRRTFAKISKYHDRSHRLHKEEAGEKELGLDPHHPHPDVLYILTKWERLLHNLWKMNQNKLDADHTHIFWFCSVV